MSAPRSDGPVRPAERSARPRRRHPIARRRPWSRFDPTGASRRRRPGPTRIRRRPAAVPAPPPRDSRGSLCSTRRGADHTLGPRVPVEPNGPHRRPPRDRRRAPRTDRRGPPPTRPAGRCPGRDGRPATSSWVAAFSSRREASRPGLRGRFELAVELFDAGPLEIIGGDHRGFGHQATPVVERTRVQVRLRRGQAPGRRVAPGQHTAPLRAGGTRRRRSSPRGPEPRRRSARVRTAMSRRGLRRRRPDATPVVLAPSGGLSLRRVHGERQHDLPPCRPRRQQTAPADGESAPGSRCPTAAPTRRPPRHAVRRRARGLLARGAWHPLWGRRQPTASAAASAAGGPARE